MPYIDIDPADGNGLAYRMLYYFFFVASVFILAFFADDYFSSIRSLYTIHWDIMTYELPYRRGFVFTAIGFAANIVVLALLALSFIRRKGKAVLIFGVFGILINLLLPFIYYLLTRDTY